MEERSKVKDIIIIIVLFIACLVVGYLISTMEDRSYRVSFDTNGGSSMSSIQLEKGTKISSIQKPTRDGYTFLYWEVDNKPVDDDFVIKKNIKLVAVWQKNEEDNTEKMYTVMFDSNGGGDVYSEKVEEGLTVDKPANPVRDGYTFKGWMLDGVLFDFNTVITKDITLKASWEKVESVTPNEPTPSPVTNPNPSPAPVKTFTVTFDSNGGSSVSSQSVKEGGKVTKPSNPTRSGYTFNGWTLNGNTYNFDSKVTQNITLKAVWTKVVTTTQVCRDVFFTGPGNPPMWENNKTNLKNYKSGTDYKTKCSGLYLRYDVQDSIVKNTYVIFSDKNITLKGGDTYANNKAILIKAFGSKKCLEDGNSEVSFDGLECRLDFDTGFYI